jgi:hypothetical protein
MKPCPHCACTTIFPSGNPIVQMKCMSCGLRGPEARDAKDAEILWDRRPDVDFWKNLAAYLGSIHAANAFEYEAKSVSKSRRGRQISILTSVHEALLDGKIPQGSRIGNLSLDDRVKAAGSRAFNEANCLQKIQDQP